MSLGDRQWEFQKDYAKLIVYIESINMMATGGEMWRSDSMQALYYYGYKVRSNEGKIELVKSRKLSNRLTNFHGRRLAVDLNFRVIDNGKWIVTYSVEDIKKAGEYWKSLDPKNVWGGDWGWDPGHFEKKI